MGIDAAVEQSHSLTTGVPWVPDSECACCSACNVHFSLVRRRHHCRNCGRIFCNRCSINSTPLPNHGYSKPVRVCNRCFLCELSPFSNSNGDGEARS
ncbi:unnamed protein product [Soboliphyme baturini]|uniref:FYVE-type domain-containing protein n=1 Tax=Soboliphyme baturini TaxID=241478 RepID=A0A183IWL2_9BILA|nr:unnamed protein product [Soboliphyme baturini]